ncbi:muscarinic acetylcholine receptor M4 isoform X2 [Columba livia]|uniref:muscarinic acetylcholine receptor M4 isoform X2 n=1 Tax=Columba livia TaxID=8932 RepID=UPI0031BB041C
MCAPGPDFNCTLGAGELTEDSLCPDCAGPRSISPAASLSPSLRPRGSRRCRRQRSCTNSCWYSSRAAGLAGAAGAPGRAPAAPGRDVAAGSGRERAGTGGPGEGGAVRGAAKERSRRPGGGPAPVRYRLPHHLGGGDGEPHLGVRKRGNSSVGLVHSSLKSWSPRSRPDPVHNLSAQPWQVKMANLTYDNFTLGNRSEVAIQPPTNYKTVELVFIATVTGSLSLVTVVGNILVMLSIKVNRQLQTVNNYFLFSLACADLIIGVFSMNLYTVYIIKGYWPLGAVVCDLWLALDYVVSNASVMNLLIISFDRYFCVTKPLTYPARRTTKMAGLMIAAAWILSFILWAPAILFWQFIVGKRTVPERECYIQFLSNPAVTFGTAIAAFYLPVVIMTVLYIHISLASRSRVRRHKPESRKERKGKSLSFFKGPLVKQNNNNSPKKAMEVKQEVRNGKVDDQPSAQTEATGHQEEKETSNESSTVSMTQTTKDKPTAEILPAGQGQSPSHPRVNPSSKWSKIKIVTKQTGTECVTAIEIVPAKAGASDHNSLANSRPVNVARKFASIARSQVRKKRQMAAREKKVTRTIFAILLAFIFTWTPYNVMVLINTFCETCVPETVWYIGYWLCYVNSTINPACYALCNATFKKTFKHLLMCQYRNIGTAR